MNRVNPLKKIYFYFFIETSKKSNLKIFLSTNKINLFSIGYELLIGSEIKLSYIEISKKYRIKLYCFNFYFFLNLTCTIKKTV